MKGDQAFLKFLNNFWVLENFKRMKQKKILPYAIVLLVVAIILLVVGKNAGWFGSSVTVKVATKVVESKTITELITANGKIQPETEVKISPDVSGEIIELYVEEGNEVTKGDLLVIIKPDVYISALNRMEATLNSAKARLAQAEAQEIERGLSFKRAKQLFEKGTIPASEFETAESSYKVAKSEVKAAQFSVKSAEASVAEAQEQLTKTKIYAPISGTISRLNVEKGERVVGTNMYAGTEMMVIANLDLMEVKVEVNENDIVKVAKGDTALVEVDAYLKRKFKGIVTEIANSANTTGATTDQVTNFDVKVLLLKNSYADLFNENENSFYPFRPGMSATVDIQTETRENVISVPIQAVTTRLVNEEKDKEEGPENRDRDKKEPEEKEEVVFVLGDDARVKKVKVETGIQDNNFIEIIKGLESGNEIVVAPYNAITRNLKDSIVVEVVKEEDLYKKK